MREDPLRLDPTDPRWDALEFARVGTTVAVSIRCPMVGCTAPEIRASLLLDRDGAGEPEVGGGEATMSIVVNCSRCRRLSLKVGSRRRGGRPVVDAPAPHNVG